MGIKVATAKEMQNIDKRAIETYKIPGVVLMENAGIRVIETLEEIDDTLEDKKIAVFAGKGNNGGDGFVVARHLANEGIETKVFLLASKNSVSGDAKTNLDIILEMGIEVEEVADENGLKDLEIKIDGFDIIIDAIFGTGLMSDVKGFLKDVICMINKSGKKVVSIDIPSGLGSDTGEIIGEHISADVTVTFALPKRGHLLFPSAKSIGELVVADISIPEQAIEEEGIGVSLLEPEDIRKIIRPRETDAHKGSYGHALVIAGSLGKSGAAGLASLGALRSGAGLVTLALPESLISGVAGSLLEVMTHPLPATGEGTISKEAVENILEKSEDMDVLVIGPGLTTHYDTVDFLIEVLKKVSKPVLIDADGINGLAIHGPDILKKIKAPLVLTPHPGEMARLIKMNVSDVQKDRLGVASDFSKKYKVFLALKGARTVISDPEGNLFINPTGNPGMATAGSGDVLSGMIGGFISQKIELLDALKAGIYLQGLAGDIAAFESGETGMIAGDILDALPLAIESILHPEDFDIIEDN